MNTPYFSIIIPVYNVEKYLPQCLDSILGQSFGNYELILINDGSKDRSLNICQNYRKRDDRIILINQENEGPSGARNKGLDSAKGKYIMFIDSDDWIEPNSLQTLYEYSSNNCPLIYFGFRAQFGNNDHIAYIHGFRHSQNKNEYYDIIYHTMENNMHNFIYGFTCNKIFRKDIIDKTNIRFDLKLRIKEDEVFTNQFCTSIEEAMIIPYALYNYRMSFGNSISFTKRLPNEYEYMADKLRETNINLDDPRIQDFQKQEYIYNLSKGITAAIRRKDNKSAIKLAQKCATQIKDIHLTYNSFTRIHFKDKVRYKFASTFWIYIISKLFNKIYTV